jgi:hypothetical protein
MISVNPSSDFSCRGHDDCDDVPSSFALPVLTIVIIVILNDGIIISITYDNVAVSKKPEPSLRDISPARFHSLNLLKWNSAASFGPYESR